MTTTTDYTDFDLACADYAQSCAQGHCCTLQTIIPGRLWRLTDYY